MKLGVSGRIFVVFSAAAVLLLALFGPRLVEKKQPQQEAGIQAPRTGVSAKGLVESGEEIVLSSQVKGQIRRMLVTAGSQVGKGQLLVEFVDDKAAAQLQQARAALASAQSRLQELSAGYRNEDVAMVQSSRQRAEAVYLEARDDLDRQQRLLKKEAATAVEVTQAERRLRVAEADLRECEANLQKYRSGVRSEEIVQARAARDRAAAEVRYSQEVVKDYRVLAPIAGLVTERMRESGESTEINTPLLKLINPSLMRVRAELDETEIGKVTVGQQAEVTADTYPGRVFQASVTRVLPTVKRKSQKSFDPAASFDINTQEVHLGLKDFSDLKNGMTVTVRFK